MGQIIIDVAKLAAGKNIDVTGWFPLEERTPEAPEGVKGGIRLQIVVGPANAGKSSKTFSCYKIRATLTERALLN